MGDLGECGGMVHWCGGPPDVSSKPTLLARRAPDVTTKLSTARINLPPRAYHLALIADRCWGCPARRNKKIIAHQQNNQVGRAVELLIGMKHEASRCRAGDIIDVPRATVGCLVSSTMGSVVATPRVVVQRRVLWMLWSCACKKRKPFCGTRPHHYCASQSAVLRPSPPAARLSPLVEPISHAARRGGNALPPPPPLVGCGRRPHGTALAPARRRSMTPILVERRRQEPDLPLKVQLMQVSVPELRTGPSRSTSLPLKAQPVQVRVPALSMALPYVPQLSRKVQLVHVRVPSLVRALHAPF